MMLVGMVIALVIEDDVLATVASVPFSLTHSFISVSASISLQKKLYTTTTTTTTTTTPGTCRRIYVRIQVNAVLSC
jgi:hypothetical protein